MQNDGDLPSLDEHRLDEMFAKAFNRKGAIIGTIGAPGNIEAMIILQFAKRWCSSDSYIEDTTVRLSVE